MSKPNVSCVSLPYAPLHFIKQCQKHDTSGPTAELVALGCVLKN
jgi:hypothetical protein